MLTANSLPGWHAPSLQLMSSSAISRLTSSAFCLAKNDTYKIKPASTWWRHKWKHFPCYWPFVRGIHRWPVNSSHKGQWRGALVLSLICAWTNSRANHRGTGDLRRRRAHYDVIVMKFRKSIAVIRHSQDFLSTTEISTQVWLDIFLFSI